jgi:hypothetical protein
MVSVVKGLFGSSDQEKALKKQQRELDAIEAGQRRLREGGRGLLAYVEDELGTLGGARRGLLRTLGGTA